jgi:hypothetical protein
VSLVDLRLMVTDDVACPLLPRLRILGYLSIV